MPFQYCCLATETDKGISNESIKTSNKAHSKAANTHASNSDATLTGISDEMDGVSSGNCCSERFKNLYSKLNGDIAWMNGALYLVL